MQQPHSMSLHHPRNDYGGNMQQPHSVSDMHSLGRDMVPARLRGSGAADRARFFLLFFSTPMPKVE